MKFERDKSRAIVTSRTSTKWTAEIPTGRLLDLFEEMTGRTFPNGVWMESTWIRRNKGDQLMTLRWEDNSDA